LTYTPASGAEVWIGSIPWEYRSKWYVGNGQQNSRKPIYLLIKLYPGSSTGKMRVYVYKDFETSPVALTIYPDDTPPDGCTVNVAGGYIEVGLDGGSGDGYVPVPMPNDWVRSLQVRLTSDKPDGALRIIDLQWWDNQTKNPDTE
jgi:hypothetical protein